MKVGAYQANIIQYERKKSEKPHTCHLTLLVPLFQKTKTKPENSSMIVASDVIV